MTTTVKPNLTRLPRLAISGLLFGLLVSTQSLAHDCDSNQAIDAYNQANKTPLMRQKLELLQMATEQCPHSFVMMQKLGDTYYANGQLPLALYTYQQILHPSISSEQQQQAVTALRLMHVYNDMGKRVEVGKYANVVQQLKQSGMVWQPQYEQAYQQAYGNYRQSLAQAPLTAEELTASIDNNKQSTRDFVVVGVGDNAERIDDIRLDISIHFAYDSANLTQLSKNELAQLVLAIQPNLANIQQLTIYGHTDSRGADEYNLILSKNRAEAVQDYLLAEMPALQDKITTIGKGEAELITNEMTEQAHALNRRVSFAFVTADNTNP